MNINEKERKVLQALEEEYAPDEWRAYAFAALCEITKLERKEVRRACRSLARKGLAAFERTLVDEEGVPAGAGYRATEQGAAFISPCDICGGRAVYDYNVEKDGTMTGNDDENTRRVLECEEHYKKSKGKKV